MNIFSFYFLAFLCVVVLLFHATQKAAPRRLVLTLANTIFLATFLATGWDVGVLVAVVLASYVSLVIVRKRPTTLSVAMCVGIAALALVFLKRYAFLEPLVPDSVLRHSIELIGISYLTFKYIHVVVDVKQGLIARVDLLTYLNYQLGFFSLVAGPIQRYNDFALFWDNIHESGSDLSALRHWRRTLVGLLKMGVLGSLALFLSDLGTSHLLASPGRLEALGSLLLLFYAYPLFVYFNFSGYCDAVIGAAGVLGMKHQENFDRPLIARNLLDFWNRWHISLTMWTRDYLFTPLYKAAVTRWYDRAVPLGYVALFITLFILGVWHGATWNFVVFGLIHGVGVVVVQLYGNELRRRLGRQGLKRYLGSSPVRITANVVTIHYVCVSFLFFHPGLRRTLMLLSTAGKQIF